MTVVTFTLSAGCADLHLLDMLTPMERKRQGYIHELIITEENYVNDLQLVTEVRSETLLCRTVTLFTLSNAACDNSSRRVGFTEYSPAPITN